MDPIGAIGLAQQCFEWTKAIIEYIQAVRDAPAERLVLLFEMQNVAALIKLLVQLNVPGTSVKSPVAVLPGEIEGPLGRMEKRMRDIKNKLEFDNVESGISTKAESAVSPVSQSTTSRLSRGFDNVRRTMDQVAIRTKELKKNAKWPFSHGEVIDHLNALERDKTFMTLFLQGNNYMLSETIERELSQVNDTTTRTHASVKVTERKVGDMFERQIDEETCAILEWLSTLDFASRQRDLCSERQIQEATGDWFLSSPQFTAWLRGDQRILFATGVGGSGKTMITSIVLEHLRTQQADVPVAFIFLDHKLQTAYGRDEIVANILKQFLLQAGTVPPQITESYKKRHKSMEPPESCDVLAALRTFIHRRNKVYIVLDALDEFSGQKTMRSKLLDDVFEIADQGEVHVMLTSRPDLTSHHKLRNVAQTIIQAHQEDIRKYLLPRLSYMPEIIRKDSKLQNLVVDGICSKAQEMFILARLHLNAISGSRTQMEIEKAIEELPTGERGLEELYGRCLERIEVHATGHRARLYRMLDILVCCGRPLRTEELQHALAVEDGAASINAKDISDIDDLVLDCEGLVTIDHKQGVVRLVHGTAHQYLKHSHLDTMAEGRVSRICLNYLSLEVFCIPQPNKESYDQLLAQYPFFEYASRYWGDHLKQNSGPQSDLETLALKFLRLSYRASDGLTTKWINDSSVQRGLEMWKGHSFDRKGHRNFQARPKHNLTSIHIVIYFGLTSILRSLLQGEADTGSEEIRESLRPLKTAVQMNRYEEAKMLLDYGAHVNEANMNHRFPLSWAVECASLDIVRLLVECGVDVNQQSTRGEGNPPFCCACMFDRADVADYLLQKGADLDGSNMRKDGSHRTPLFYVMDKGRPKCRELLLFKYKVMSPKRARRLLLPMENAILLRRLILEAGVDPQQTFGLGQSALDVAIRLQDMDLVKLSLDMDVRPRVYWERSLEEIKQLSIADWFPRLCEVLAKQQSPTISHEEGPVDGWKSDYEHAWRKFIRFELPPERFGHPPSKVIFTIISHDQGESSFPHDHGSYHGGSSVFLAEIAEKRDGKQPLVTENRPRIVQNIHASEEWKQHVVVWERDDARPEVKQWMRELLPGRIVRVCAAAADYGWENYVKYMRVEVFA